MLQLQASELDKELLRHIDEGNREVTSPHALRRTTHCSSLAAGGHQDQEGARLAP